MQTQLVYKYVVSLSFLITSPSLPVIFLVTIDLSDELDKLVEKQTLQEAKIEYAVNTMQDLAKQWRDADYDLRVRFQSMVFPEGATFDMTTMQFGTESISPLYRYIPNKNDLSVKEKSHLVTLRGSTWNTYWNGFVRLSEQLEELGIGDEEADNV